MTEQINTMADTQADRLMTEHIDTMVERQTYRQTDD